MRMKLVVVLLKGKSADCYVNERRQLESNNVILLAEKIQTFLLRRFCNVFKKDGH
jgi:hypothetical protein